ncbi:MAG: hypothetical protein KKA62_03385, partial [Nanoarchaeota archaeon]|nr:hypothetical protein [Nanoarchaeota archaeon]
CLIYCFCLSTSFLSFTVTSYFLLHMNKSVKRIQDTIGKESPINRTYVKTTLILGLIPGVWYIEMLILMPIVIGITQSASNKLVGDK